MENVLLQLPGKVSPEAVKQGTPGVLHTGHINYGKELFDTFGADLGQDNKVNRVHTWAEALDCAQFAGACKTAQEIADVQDKATGFVAEPDATGVGKYGPSRRVINARMSEAKALFGVWQRDSSLLKERGYWHAVQTARDYLDAQGIKWDGTPKESVEHRQNKKINKEMEQAMKEAKLLHPQQQGESIKSYMIRIAELADDIAEQVAIDKVVSSITSLHPDKEILLSGVFYFLKSQGKEQLENFAEQLFDAAAEMAGIKTS